MIPFQSKYRTPRATSRSRFTCKQRSWWRVDGWCDLAVLSWQ